MKLSNGYKSLVVGIGMALASGPAWSVSSADFLDLLKGSTPDVEVNNLQSGAEIINSHAVVTGIVSAVEGNGVDMMIAMDNSASLMTSDATSERFEAIRQLLSGFGTGVDARIGLSFFSASASVAVALREADGAVSSFNQAMDNTTPSGDTNLAAGIRAAMEELQQNGRADSTKIILLFTDGEESNSQAKTVAAEAAAAGMIVHVIGLFSPLALLTGQQVMVENIASAGNGEIFRAVMPSQLLTLFRDLKITGVRKVTVTNTTTGAQASTDPADGVSNISTAGCGINAVVPLEQGENEITVEVTNIIGTTTTETLTLNVPVDCPDPNGPHLANYNPDCPVTQNPPGVPVTKLRPQVLMAGFDPMLLDIGDSEIVVKAVVREGAQPIRHVTLSENTGSFPAAMQLEGELPNGDKVYSLTFVGARLLPGTQLSNLFGSKAGEFNITVIDEAQQRHSFPHLLTNGSYPDVARSAAASQAPAYTRQGIRRNTPQTLMVGFDPAMVDMTDDSFNIKALVRRGTGAIRNVALKTNNNLFSLAMNKEEDLDNGDSLYSLPFTFSRGAFPPGAFRDLFGAEYEGEFVVTAIDEFFQEHSFPTLEVCNCPPLK